MSRCFSLQAHGSRRCFLLFAFCSRRCFSLLARCSLLSFAKVPRACRVPRFLSVLRLNPPLIPPLMCFCASVIALLSADYSPVLRSYYCPIYGPVIALLAGDKRPGFYPPPPLKEYNLTPCVNTCKKQGFIRTAGCSEYSRITLQYFQSHTPHTPPKCLL